MMLPVTHAALPLVFVNGKRVAADAPAISARDRGLTLADGLFETMRAHRGVVFRLDRHLTRLAAGLRVLEIPEPRGLGEMVDGAVASYGQTDASIRLTVTRGSGPGGLVPPSDPTPTVVVTVSSMPAFAPEIYSQGLRAVVASGRRNEQAMTVGLKTLAYADSVMALLDAQRRGADEAIFLDTDGHCSEATASNLFIYRDGTLLTPPVTCAALPGITRATVLELARAAGIAAVEQSFGTADLSSAGEAFLTSSLRGIAPVAVVDGQRIGSTMPGTVTRQLTAAYHALVEQECGGR